MLYILLLYYIYYYVMYNYIYIICVYIYIYKTHLYGIQKDGTDEPICRAEMEMHTQRRTSAREPSKCLNGQSNRERLAKQATLRLISPQRLRKKTDRAITPLAGAVCVPAHSVLPGSLQPKWLHHLHSQPTLEQNCHRQKKKKQVLHLCLWGCFGHVQLFVTLCTVAYHASLSGGFSRQEYQRELANTACHTLLEHCISCHPSHQLP